VLRGLDLLVVDPKVVSIFCMPTSTPRACSSVCDRPYCWTDSPLLVGAYYSSTFDSGEFAEKLRDMTMVLHNEHPSVNFFIRRTKP
jgi:hypothetical protein